jgi:hypothetical protein
MRQALDAEALKADPFVLSSSDPAELQAAMVAHGPVVRLGYYPGSFPMPYQRVQDPKTNRWTADSQLSSGYRRYLELRGEESSTRESAPVDPAPSAVAESE